MNEEKRKILEHLVEYLQDKIDTGYHKIFYNDDMYDEKTIDCINVINDTLEENKKLNNIIEDINYYIEQRCNEDINDTEMAILKSIELISKGIIKVVKEK